MFDIEKILIDHFVKELESSYVEFFGSVDSDNASIVTWFGHLALENICNSDALYHNVDHTMMVTLVGKEILKGKHLSEGGVTQSSWLNFMVALLCHDIGYVRGICRNDDGNFYDTGIDGKTVEIPRGGTDAALTPYHVDRSKQFVRDRLKNCNIASIDIEEICSYIEITRFPMHEGDFYKDTKNLPGLARAADFIGQLGDPEYLRKLPGLFYEFSETGANEKLGYKKPEDMRKGFATFYWNVIRPYIQDALKYLRVTQEGKQWIANLHSHVFEVEHPDD